MDAQIKIGVDTKQQLERDKKHVCTNFIMLVHIMLNIKLMTTTRIKVPMFLIMTMPEQSQTE